MHRSLSGLAMLAVALSIAAARADEAGSTRVTTPGGATISVPGAQSGMPREGVATPGGPVGSGESSMSGQGAITNLAPAAGYSNMPLAGSVGPNATTQPSNPPALQAFPSSVPGAAVDSAPPPGPPRPPIPGVPVYELPRYYERCSGAYIGRPGC